MVTLQLSIEFIIVILIGGAFSLHGAVLGAIFIVHDRSVLTYLKDDIPGGRCRRRGDAWRGRERAAPFKATSPRSLRRNGLKGAIYA